MGDRHTWTAAPAAAERARSVLAAAWSCAVTAEGGREEFVGAHSVTEDGRVILCVPEDSTLVAAAICAPRGEPSAVLEFADVAPVPVRNRIRARLWIAGWFAPKGGDLEFKATRIVLREPSGAVVVDLDEFAAAAPDPLATAESRLLTHLADAHPDAVERLTRLVPHDSLHGAVRVQPLAVDRHGLTLRIERARGNGDVRLTFHKPADDMAQLTERMHILLSRASAASCPRALQRQRTDGDG
ncbi:MULTISPECIES: DUF2470 domain-containing protein [unclassified Streptomyces]|uniref:DUF2470 domain-containing protein n=1 Tax=unclassified Streptomyces TaxID=2593676 RepID=UPI002E7A6697|nr:MULTISPECIES: DUF2470 domain-containing protein [unclassified Streptomyces]MEE1760453.1 DUF2470 domain-containing protein [Streptomyces sp. SP18BB07]MEE1833149.1 DUF2470 domain-containing protein [Streptomyces sp. SP17KL33]